MIEFLITMLILCVVIYVVYMVVGMLKLPAPISTIVYLIIGLIFLVVILDKSGVYHLNLGRGGL